MKLLAQSLLLLLLYSQPNFALALPQCGAPTATCIDSTPCKTISGVTACLSTATLPLGATRFSRDCWDTQKDYSCDLVQIDTCSALAADGCTQSNSVCSQTDANGNCTLYSNTYTCMTTSVLSNTTCTGIPTACILKTSSCMTTSSPGTTIAGQCTATSKTYECPVPSTTSTTTTNCAGQTYCQGTQCTNSGNKANADLGKVAAAMELARQAAAYYDPSTMTVFKGLDKSCTVQLWTAGLGGDCCKITGGGQTNNQVAEMLIGSGIQQSLAAAGIAVANPSAGGSVIQKVASAGVSAVGTYATSAYNSASSYVYDIFFPGDLAAKQLTDGMISGVSNMVSAVNAGNVATQAAAPIIDQSTQLAGTTPSSLFSSFSYYGVTLSATAPVAGTMAAGMSTQVGSYYLYFSPWGFAAAIALQVIMEAIACTEPEKKLMQMRGSNLCQPVGSYCSNKLNLLIATICLEETQSFCCYNSKLAKIVNQQGRPQIPKGWGAAQAPSCAGFTMAEMELIDFSQMDLGEFIADLTKRLPDPATVQAGVKAKVDIMYNNAPAF